MTERRGCVRAWALAIAVLVGITLTAFAQNPRPRDPAAAPHSNCGAANGGGPNSTNYYGTGDPCAYLYSVPAERLASSFSMTTILAPWIAAPR